MGGYSNYTPPTIADKIREKLGAFFNAGVLPQAQNFLYEAYQLAKHEEDSLVNALNSLSKLENGLTGIEIEMKLAVPAQKLAHANDPPTSAHQRLREYQVTNHTQFLPDPLITNSSGKNYYYGTEREERFILIENEAGWHLKAKGCIEPYLYNIPSAEFVLKRKESLKQYFKKNGNNDVHAETIHSFVELIVTACEPTPVKSMGVMNKDKSTQYILERNTCRVYSITLGACTAEKREPLVQLEIEYAGYIPKFAPGKTVETEPAIIQDILTLAKEFEKYDLKPTKLTKFDWLIGKKESSREEKLPVITAAQVFFNDTLDELVQPEKPA